ncbi:AAA family ATPase [Ktedonospora formicarum]|uniref:AAA family ATPase n=1 Tax=Ktedonospora formicarum TaxID=2778364 RepID=UPI001F29D3D7|nr:AAA family ATPase [Ktedonospora formicarum]
MKAQIGQQLERARELEQREQQLRERLEQQRQQSEEYRQKAREQSEHLKSIEARFVEIEQQMAATEQERTRLQREMSERESAYRRALLESQKARDAVDTLLGQIHEELGIEDPQELLRQAESVETSNEADLSAVDTGERLTEEEEAHLRKLRRRVDTLRSRLKAMGGYDESAPQLYEETKTRYEFLSSQISDLDQAALQLHTIIDQLDATMAKQFDSTFQAIAARFGQHFTTLFNGGNARLELVRAKVSEEEGDTSTARPSSMPTGIEVIVQPPGKKVQDLSLLSGGERALVSAALLFSLLEVNPPPFCLLDEVDAALDESNVTRFSDILRSLAQKTQFIVITHNRVTMTGAQVIYGVSMRESVSRMLSIRLETAVAQ